MIYLSLSKLDKINISRLIVLIGGIAKLAVKIGGTVPGKIGGLVNKAFGNSCYAHQVSQYDGVDYQKISNRMTIYNTEDCQKIL